MTKETAHRLWSEVVARSPVFRGASLVASVPYGFAESGSALDLAAGMLRHWANGLVGQNAQRMWSEAVADSQVLRGAALQLGLPCHFGIPHTRPEPVAEFLLQWATALELKETDNG
jgi:hypothetical protein